MVEIFRAHGTHESVEADVFHSFSRSVAEQTHRAWTAFKASHRSADIPDHHHWDWLMKKGASYNPTIIGIQYGGEVQGLLLMQDTPLPGRGSDAEGLYVAYVAYVEAAPWNVRAYVGGDVRFLGVGSALITLAIEASERMGCGGRIGLHSLPAAEAFYLTQGFLKIGYDVEEELNYFELSGNRLGKSS